MPSSIAPIRWRSLMSTPRDGSAKADLWFQRYFPRCLLSEIKVLSRPSLSELHAATPAHWTTSSRTHTAMGLSALIFLRPLRKPKDLKASTPLPACNREKTRQHWTFRNDRPRAHGKSARKTLSQRADSYFCDSRESAKLRTGANKISHAGFSADSKSMARYVQ